MIRPSATKQRKLYEEVMGRPPTTAPAHPLSWQWQYRGSKAERERLAATLGARR